MYEEEELDIKKVFIKLSPGVWIQDSLPSYPETPRNMLTKAEEDPEADAVVNRKYLCLNETVKKHLPTPDKFSSLPVVISIRETVEEKSKKIQQWFENDDEIKIRGVIMVYMLSGAAGIRTDLYHIRFDTKEIMEYKIAVAAKYGFGGIALASINDDDIDEVCGPSLFKRLG